MKILKHPEHGFHVVSYTYEVEEMKRLGWEVYNGKVQRQEEEVVCGSRNAENEPQADLSLIDKPKRGRKRVNRA